MPNCCRLFFTVLIEDTRTSFSNFLISCQTWLHCNPIQGQYRARTRFSLWSFPHREKPVFIYREPLFSLQGLCFHYREWVCSVLEFIVWMQNVKFKPKSFLIHTVSGWCKPHMSGIKSLWWLSLIHLGFEGHNRVR